MQCHDHGKQRWHGHGAMSHATHITQQQYRRAMEADNAKRRKAERREFNENVRALAAFVKKRDKRVAAHQAAEAVRRAERAAEEAAKREAQRAERARRAAAYKDPDWVVVRGGGWDVPCSDLALFVFLFGWWWYCMEFVHIVLCQPCLCVYFFRIVVA